MTLIGFGWRWTHRRTGIEGGHTGIEGAMLTAAQAGQFQRPPNGMSYSGAIKCRVDRPHAFHGADVYLCKIGASEWEWGALLDGTLHTHATDPNMIPTITGPWDPPLW